MNQEHLAEYVLGGLAIVQSLNLFITGHLLGRIRDVDTRIYEHVTKKGHDA